MNNLRTAPFALKVFYIIFLFGLSTILFFLGSGFSTALYAAEAQYISPFFTGIPSDEPWFDILVPIYLGPLGFAWGIAAAIGYTLPMALLMIVLVSLDKFLGLTKRLPSLWLFLTRGFPGKLLRLFRINTFTGDMILENRLVTKHENIVTPSGLLKVFLTTSKRTLLIPASVAGLVWVFIGGDLGDSVPAVFLGTIPILLGLEPQPIVYLALITVPVLFFFLFFPAVSVLEQAGVRLVQYSSQKDIGNISNLGESIFSFSESIFGLSAILLLSGRLTGDWMSAYVSAANFPTITELLLNVFFVFPYGLLYALSYILILLSFLIPSAGILLLFLYPIRAIEASKHVRNKLQRKGKVPIGAVVLKTFTEES